MRVLIVDEFEEQGVAALRAAGCEVFQLTGLKDAALAAAVRDCRCEVLIVRSTRVSAEVLAASKHLALVVRAGAGYDTIDVAAASRRSVFVANCPGRNAVAVAELTFGLILALDRLIVDGTVDLRAGRWNKKLYSEAMGLKGRTLGVIGTGRIGRAVIRRAQAFEMNVLAWSRSLDAAGVKELCVEPRESIEAVAADCDILTLHLAATDQTRKRVGSTVFEAMKPDSMLINTSRGDLLDYDALRQAVADKRLRVGLDVFEREPKEGVAAFADPIMQTEGVVYGTHHIGASTRQAQAAIAEETVRIVCSFLRNGTVENCVNRRQKTPARFMLLVRHRNRPGVLAHTLGAISDAGVNVEEMENVISEGAEAACARITLNARLGDAVISRIETGHEHVFSVTQSPLID
ncbi:MAG: hydroxyacid dehydrogenase [Planctomycetes bacterium]|nr:hydroxyacid dehydrogenase [Planctomycetota bacterium]